MLTFLKILLSGHPTRAARHLVYAWRLRHPQEPLRLHLGCGQRCLEGFVNIDMNTSATTDYVGDITRLPCPAGSVGRIEAYHVIEHLPRPIVAGVLCRWLAALAPGGVLVLECPDVDRAMREYLAGDHDRLFSIYGRQRFPGDAHHWGYSPATLVALLRDAGFDDAVVTPALDYHAGDEPCLRVEASRSLVTNTLNNDQLTAPAMAA